MDLLSIFDQSFQQRWRRIAEELTEFNKNELGIRMEGRNPTLWRKHDVISTLLGDQIKQTTTH